MSRKSSVVIPEAIVFVTAIESRQCAFSRRWHDAWIDEDTDRDRHFIGGNQFVKNGRRVIVSLGLHIVRSVAERSHTCGLFTVVLRWHIDPNIADGAREDLGTDRRRTS